MSAKLGIPYMGSKRKLASEILLKITQRHENISDFYDMFGGGGSVSFTAIRDHRFNVHYNELNKRVFELVKYLKNHTELEPKFYEWVTREMFFEQINKPNDLVDWYSGFVMCCWSFGNNQNTYLYGKDIEESKRLAHESIVNGCMESMHKLGVDIPDLVKVKGIRERRVLFCSHIEKITQQRFDMQSLEPITLLEHLTRFQNLQNLQIYNGSYESVPIAGDNPVIYCDIPYKQVATYQKKKGKNVNNYEEIETRIVKNIRFNKNGEPYEYARRYPVKGQGVKNAFNHEEFYQWFANLPYPAYLSEYDAPFEKIEMFSHRSSLSAINNKKKVYESIFWNGKGKILRSKLF